MNLAWFVARRYLFSRDRNALISVNTLISVMGVAVGVAALVVVIGVMDGAYKLLMRQITSIQPHVRLVPFDGGQQPLDPALLPQLRAMAGVERVDPIINKQAFIQLPRGSQAQKQGIQLFGLERLGPNAPFAFNLPPKFTPLHIGEHEIILGRPLAQKLNAQAGTPVLLIIQSPLAQTGASPFRPVSLRVAGIAECGYYEFDSRTAWINPTTLRDLFPQPGPDYISIRLTKPAQARAFAAHLSLPDYSTRSWEDENMEFFASLLIQKYGLFIILSLIILVSAFNIIGTLILMVTDKTREIGILRAVGAGRGFIARVYLLIGVLIGMAGTVTGLVLGVGIAELVPYVPIDLPESIYNFDRLPMELRPQTLALIALCALVICTLGALIPAIQAARLNPAEAVRYD